jgi:hypothetical protein
VEGNLQVLIVNGAKTYRFATLKQLRNIHSIETETTILVEKRVPVDVVAIQPVIERQVVPGDTECKQ